MLLLSDDITLLVSTKKSKPHEEKRWASISYSGYSLYARSILVPSGRAPFVQHRESRLNLLCLQIHSKPECRWTWSEVAILGAGQKERGLWERECARSDSVLELERMRTIKPKPGFYSSGFWFRLERRAFGWALETRLRYKPFESWKFCVYKW